MNSRRQTALCRPLCADDATANRTPSAWMISLFSLPTGKSCSWCGSLYPSTNGSVLPSAEGTGDHTLSWNRKIKGRPQ
jgi:hypothetical protein